VLNIGQAGMWAAIVMGAIVLGVCALRFRQLVAFTFDETVSRTLGIRTTLLYFCVLIMLTLIVVVSIRLLGLILVSALLIMPGAAALLLSRRLGRVLVLSAVVGVVGTLGGLIVSLEVGRLSTGACIVFVLFGLFLAAYVTSAVRGRATA
jgi:ABC-type Mn2+/Zn2+ transport system permease subunit